MPMDEAVAMGVVGARGVAVAVGEAVAIAATMVIIEAMAIVDHCCHDECCCRGWKSLSSRKSLAVAATMVIGEAMAIGDRCCHDECCCRGLQSLLPWKSLAVRGSGEGDHSSMLTRAVSTLGQVPKMLPGLIMLALVIVFYAWFGVAVFYGSPQGKAAFPNLVVSARGALPPLAGPRAAPLSSSLRTRLARRSLARRRKACGECGRARLRRPWTLPSCGHGGSHRGNDGRGCGIAMVGP